MKPTKSQVRVDKILTNIAVAYRNPEYIWRSIFPVIPVKNDSDKYYIFTKGDWFRNEAKLRAPGTAARLSGFGLSTASYNAQEKALATKIADRVLQNSDNVLALRTAKTEYVADKVELAREYELATTICTTGVWGTDSTLGTTWDDESSTPVDDVITIQDAVAGETGKEINVALLGRQVWSQLRRHPDVLDILSATERQIATPALLAQAFDIDKIVIGKAIYNSAEEGASDSFSYVWGKHALFMYVTPTPGIMTPTAGYSFMSRDARVRTWVNEEEEATYIEASNILDFKVVSSDVGYYINAAVA